MLSVPALARAQAFGLNEIGTCATGRASAVVAKPCDDGSAVFWNPAATVRLSGWSLYVGGSSISVTGSFTQDTTGIKYPGDVPTEFPPALFVNYRATPRVAIGIGGYVPYGLTSQWKPDFPGRFNAQKASIQTIYVQPNIAIDLVPGRLSIGGGPIWGHSSLELKQSADLSEVPLPGQPFTFGMIGIPQGTEFARVSAKGSGTAWGFQLGAHATLSPSWQLGARYLSKLTFDYDADAKFTQVATGLTVPANNGLGLPAGATFDQLLAPQFQSGGPLVAQTMSTTIEHPQQAQVGLAYTGWQRTTVEADYEWVNWASFKELPITFEGPAASRSRVAIEDYSDAHIFRVSADHQYLNGWATRAGFAYNKAPVPDETVTPLLPDMDRYVFGLGVSLPVVRQWTLDASYLRVQTEGRRGRLADRSRPASAPPGTVVPAPPNTGFFELGANIFSLGIRAHF